MRGCIGRPKQAYVEIAPAGFTQLRCLDNTRMIRIRAMSCMAFICDAMLYLTTNSIYSGAGGKGPSSEPVYQQPLT